MYTSFVPSPEAEVRSKALIGTALIGLMLLLLLLFSHLSAPARVALQRPVIDSLAIVYLPLHLAYHHAPVRRIAPIRESRSMAPAARFSPKFAPARPVAAPLPGNSRPIITTNVPAPVEEPKVDERGLYRKTENPGNGTTPTARTPEGGNPTGQPGGQVANLGGTGGMGLDLAGFRFGRLSVAPDPYDETGRIVFVVNVDADGQVLSLAVASASVSPSVTEWYRRQLQLLRLQPTSSGQRPDVSTGRITLTITAR